ncbi:MAG: hypothetical protein FJW20_20455 [Acidimicrobiia bacterium]|nr:hypothetical protein [Acidimicrobiia bacterium]
MSTTIIRRVLKNETRQRLEFLNLTPRIEEVVSESGIGEGTVMVQSLHSTAATILNEWQEALLDDLRRMMEAAVPAGGGWRHDDPRYSDCTRANAVSHLRAMLLGPGVMLPVVDGRLVRGTWQSIILAEMDGPRTCSVSVQVMGVEQPRVRASEEWEAWFRRSLENPPEIPWESAARITDEERERIRASIQEFQLGEQSEGRHLRQAAREYARRSGDAAYARGTELFIREEQGHAALLGRFMDLAGIARVRHTWVDAVFRHVRKLAGLETSICVLLTAELIAKVYYPALAAATGCPALRAICARISKDEGSHVQFHCERLAMMRARRAPVRTCVALALQRLLLAGAAAVVWFHHEPVLRVTHSSMADYWRCCQLEFRAAFHSGGRRPVLAESN